MKKGGIILEHLITGMRKTISELIAWQSAHQDVPDYVNQAIQSYKGEMRKAIESMLKPPFEVGDPVELVSSSYEDSGLFSGDTGIVIQSKSTILQSGHDEHSIRVIWDKGAGECWIDADDFIGR